MSETQAPYLTRPTLQFVALGKVAGLWHVVVRDGEGGHRLVPLVPRRRRAFTAAELAPAERFPSEKEARGVGRSCGFARTYATREPARAMPSTAELARRPIVQALRPIDAAEAAQLAEYQERHPEDVAAVGTLSKPALIAGIMMLQYRGQILSV